MSSSVKVSHLSKVYRLYKRPTDRIIEVLTPLTRHDAVKALDDVSFEIEPGEVIGLVGRNGAGKSTLLKMLAGVATQSSGTVETSGKVAAILELGAGFHPEFTGRANAELNAAILGLGPDEIRECLPEMLEFSELGSFLDRPVRTYSSGMVMRLGFSVAVHVDPDILLVDEALAVGDGHFQKKSLDRMREFLDRKKTIVFCSHSLGAISAICSRTIWLERGRLEMFGPSAKVIRAYEMDLMRREEDTSIHSVQTELPDTPSPVRVREATVTDDEGTATKSFFRGETIVARIAIESQNPDEPIHVLVGLDRPLDQLQCSSFATHWDGLEPLSGSRQYEVELRIRNSTLTPADYRLYVFVGDGSSLHLYDRTELSFSIDGAGDPGVLFEAEHRWMFK